MLFSSIIEPVIDIFLAEAILNQATNAFSTSASLPVLILFRLVTEELEASSQICVSLSKSLFKVVLGKNQLILV